LFVEKVAMNADPGRIRQNDPDLTGSTTSKKVQKDVESLGQIGPSKRKQEGTESSTNQS
jgi:hypothetical protein